MPDHLILALEHHKQLIEDARRHQERLIIGEMQGRPVRVRRLRHQVGELLIRTGQWLKADTADVAWG
jgi:hypothetical protein